MRPVRQRSRTVPAWGLRSTVVRPLDFAAGLGRGLWLLTVIDGAQSHATAYDGRGTGCATQLDLLTSGVSPPVVLTLEPSR